MPDLHVFATLELAHDQARLKRVDGPVVQDAGVAVPRQLAGQVDPPGERREHLDHQDRGCRQVPFGEVLPTGHDDVGLQGVAGGQAHVERGHEDLAVCRGSGFEHDRQVQHHGLVGAPRGRGHDDCPVEQLDPAQLVLIAQPIQELVVDIEMGDQQRTVEQLRATIVVARSPSVQVCHGEAAAGARGHGSHGASSAPYPPGCTVTAYRIGGCPQGG